MKTSKNIFLIILMTISCLTLFSQHHAEIISPDEDALLIKSPGGNFGQGPVTRLECDFNSTIYNAVMALIPDDVNKPHRNNSLEFRSPLGGRINFFINPTNVLLEDLKMTIRNSGNVGIGTDNPSRRLDVVADTPNNGVSTIHNLDGAGFAGTYFHSNNINKGYVGYVGSGNWVDPNTMQLGALGNVDIKFLANSNTPMVIKAINENIGMGIPEPSENLHVKRGVRIESTTNDPTPKTVYGNSMPLAYGSFLSTGVIEGEYGISSVSHTGTGIYEIVLDNEWIDVPAVQSMIRFQGLLGQDITMTHEVDQSTKTIEIYIADASSGVGKDAAFSLTVFGTPITSTGSGCQSESSLQGIAQAPFDNVKWNAVEDACCIVSLPFAPSDPTPHFQVSVLDFTNPPATSEVEVMLTINDAIGGGSTSQTVTLTNAGMSVSAGTFKAANGNDYDVVFDLGYDGVDEVTASVSVTAL